MFSTSLFYIPKLRSISLCLKYDANPLEYLKLRVYPSKMSLNSQVTLIVLP